MKKVTLVLEYSKDVPNDDMDFVTEAVAERDMQTLDEYFGIGWDGPSKVTLRHDSPDNKLAKLLEQVTPDNQHGESMAGAPVGKELL